MGLNVGAAASGSLDSFQKFSLSRFAYKHLFVVENKVGGLDMPSLFVSRGTFPYNEITAYPIERDNSNIYYPELVDCNQLEIEFYETMDNMVWNYFEGWNNLIYNKKDKDNVVFNLPDHYKKDIYMFRLDTMPKEGQNELTRVFGYIYEGCFPIRITDYPLDMADPGIVSLGLTFSCDNVRRLESGHGISEPEMLDRASVKMDSSPLKEQKSTRKNTTMEPAQPKAGLASTGDAATPEIKSPEVKIEPPSALSKLGDAVGARLKATFGGYLSTGIFLEAILKAAAQTGINIGIREAYYLAYSAAKKQGVEGIFGGGIGSVVGGARSSVKGGSLPK